MWPRVIRMISSGKLPVEKIVTGRIEPEAIVEKGFRSLLNPSGQEMKVMVNMQLRRGAGGWTRASGTSWEIVMEIVALVVGATGIAGRGVSQATPRCGARVYGLSRHREGSSRASSILRPTFSTPQASTRRSAESSRATCI